jgi:hypothetical protein
VLILECRASRKFTTSVRSELSELRISAFAWLYESCYKKSQFLEPLYRV